MALNNGARIDQIFPAAALVVLDVVAQRVCDRVRPFALLLYSQSAASLRLPLFPGNILSRPKIQDCSSVCLLEIVGRSERNLEVSALADKPSRYPSPAALPEPAIAHVQSGLDHTPVRLAARFEAEPCSAGFEVRIADGPCHMVTFAQLMPDIRTWTWGGNSRQSWTGWQLKRYT